MRAELCELGENEADLKQQEMRKIAELKEHYILHIQCIYIILHTHVMHILCGHKFW